MNVFVRSYVDVTSEEVLSRRAKDLTYNLVDHASQAQVALLVVSKPLWDIDLSPASALLQDNQKLRIILFEDGPVRRVHGSLSVDCSRTDFINAMRAMTS